MRQRGLATGCGARVKDQVPRLGVDDVADPLRCRILHITVGSFVNVRLHIHTFEHGDRVVMTLVGDKQVEQPVWITEPDCFAWPLDVCFGDLTEDGVDKPAHLFGRKRHRRIDRSMVRGRQVVKLIGAKAQQRSYMWIHFAHGEAVNQEVT